MFSFSFASYWIHKDLFVLDTQKVIFYSAYGLSLMEQKTTNGPFSQSVPHFHAPKATFPKQWWSCVCIEDPLCPGASPMQFAGSSEMCLPAPRFTVSIQCSVSLFNFHSSQTLFFQRKKSDVFLRFYLLKKNQAKYPHKLQHSSGISPFT